jgi:hypothetical protein
MQLFARCSIAVHSQSRRADKTRCRNSTSTLTRETTVIKALTSSPETQIERPVSRAKMLPASAFTAAKLMHATNAIVTAALLADGASPLEAEAIAQVAPAAVADARAAAEELASTRTQPLSGAAVALSSSLAAAPTARAYLRTLRDQKGLSADADELRVPLSLLHGSHAGRGASKDARSIQAVRDVERDRFRVLHALRREEDHDAPVLQGSVVGYAGVLAEVTDALLEAAAALDRGLGSASAPFSAGAVDTTDNKEAFEELAAHLLRTGNRTVSGGDAYEAALKLLDPRASIAGSGGSGGSGGLEASPVLLVADSHAAPPIDFVVEIHPFEKASSVDDIASSTDFTALNKLLRTEGEGIRSELVSSYLRWTVGARVTVRATTVYRMLLQDQESTGNESDASEDDDEDNGAPSEGGLRQIGTLRATYTRAFGLDLLAMQAAQKHKMDADEWVSDCDGYVTLHLS